MVRTHARTPIDIDAAAAQFSDADWRALNALIADAQHWLAVVARIDADGMRAVSMSDTDTPDGHGDLKAWARALRRPLETLHVLTAGNDPYMAAMPSRLELARWFAQLYDGLKIQVAVMSGAYFICWSHSKTPSAKRQTV